MPQSRVLVVDDDRAIRDVISEILEEGGYHVHLATNGCDALGLARTHQPLVVLMDLMMPVMDGPTAIHRLKGDPTTAWIQIVAMSAGVNLHTLAERLIPVDGLLAKPFDLELLLAQVELRALQAALARANLDA